MTTQPKLRFSTVFFDLLIDLALVGAGVLIYAYFSPNPEALKSINPDIIEMIGGAQNALYLIAGLPFLIGSYSLIRLIVRVIRRGANLVFEKRKEKQRETQ